MCIVFDKTGLWQHCVTKELPNSIKPIVAQAFSVMCGRKSIHTAMNMTKPTSHTSFILYEITKEGCDCGPCAGPKVDPISTPQATCWGGRVRGCHVGHVSQRLTDIPIDPTPSLSMATCFYDSFVNFRRMRLKEYPMPRSIHPQ